MKDQIVQGDLKREEAELHLADINLRTGKPVKLGCHALLKITMEPGRRDSGEPGQNQNGQRQEPVQESAEMPKHAYQFTPPRLSTRYMGARSTR